jgi:hypothetical protein
LGIKSSGLFSCRRIRNLIRAQRIRCAIYDKPDIACQAIPGNEPAQGSPALAAADHPTSTQFAKGILARPVS